MPKIKFLVMDVDGTLTDGKIYMGQEGEIAKAFNIKDGCGISLVLPRYDIIPVIITARESRILENRCKELNIEEIYQGCKDKLSILNSIIETHGADLSSVAYVGDDLPDIPCMEAIKDAGGIVLCPADAIGEIKIISDYVSWLNAGEGAIRDCIDFIVRLKATDIQSKVRETIDLILKENFSDKIEGILSNGSKYAIQMYITKPEDDCVIETHRNHVDIQLMLEGHEVFRVYQIKGLVGGGKYNHKKDIEFWENGTELSSTVLLPGSITVVYNQQPHKGAIQFKNAEIVKKVVCKVEV